MKREWVQIFKCHGESVGINVQKVAEHFLILRRKLLIYALNDIRNAHEFDQFYDFVLLLQFCMVPYYVGKRRKIERIL